MFKNTLAMFFSSISLSLTWAINCSGLRCSHHHAWVQCLRCRMPRYFFAFDLQIHTDIFRYHFDFAFLAEINRFKVNPIQATPDLTPNQIVYVI